MIEEIIENPMMLIFVLIAMLIIIGLAWVWISQGVDAANFLKGLFFGFFK